MCLNGTDRDGGDMHEAKLMRCMLMRVAKTQGHIYEGGLGILRHSDKYVVGTGDINVDSMVKASTLLNNTYATLQL